MNYALVKALSIMESSLFGVIRLTLVIWWTTLRRWTFFILRTSFLSSSTERRLLREVRRLWLVTPACLTSWKWIKIQERTRTRRKLKTWLKRITKLEKCNLQLPYSAMMIQLTLRRLRKSFTCLGKFPKINLWSSDIKEPVTCISQLAIL